MACMRIWLKPFSCRDRRRISLKQRLALMAVMLGIAIGNGIVPAHADQPIDPKLRQQVLQILRENPEVIIQAVQDYQRQLQEKQEKERQAFLQQIAANPKALIGRSPTKGAKDARVVLVEFSDFQCPFCAGMHGTLKQFMAKHQDQVVLVYKHLPLPTLHQEALPAAKAAWAAGQQGKFWEYHDALFDQQEQLGDALYKKIAIGLKLDLARFERDRTSKAAAIAIAEDMAIAQKLGVDGTPFFLMNGTPFSGAVSLTELEAILAKVKRPIAYPSTFLQHLQVIQAGIKSALS